MRIFKPRRTSGSLSFWQFFSLLLLLTGFVFLGWVLLNPTRVLANAPGPVPVALHSTYAADYSADPENYVVPEISLDLIEEFLQDAKEESGGVEINRILLDLKSPVPVQANSGSVIQKPTWAPEARITLVSAATFTPTSTIISAEVTLLPEHTPVPSISPQVIEPTKTPPAHFLPTKKPLKTKQPEDVQPTPHSLEPDNANQTSAPNNSPGSESTPSPGNPER